VGISTTKLTHLHASLFDSVRRIRAEALSLLETTDEIITLLNDTSLAEDEVQMRKKHALAIGDRIIHEHGPEVEKYFEAINTLLAQHPELNVQSGEDVSTDITVMHDEWEKAIWNWPDTSEGKLPSNQELLFQLDEVKQAVYTLGVRAQILTFPDLVNQRLQDMHTGEQLDFFHEFADEFYKPEFLPIAWRYLREHPDRINGFMSENGIIYRASPFAPRFLSSLLIAGIVASGFVLIWVAGVLNYFPLPSVDVLFRGYIAIMAGGLVHTFVDVWKQFQTKPDHATNMLGNWILWVHVKQVSIVSGILTLWAGFIILVAIQQIGDAGAAFFAGYSIDSFIGLFLVRFTDTASQSVARLGVQSAPKSTRQQVTDVLAQSAKSSSLQH
jgi:hypothetical protein